jgi:hypothetical protein
MSSTCQYLSDCKRYFEKKYIVPLPIFHVMKSTFLFGYLIGLSWRIYHDGFSYITLLPMSYSKTATFTELLYLVSIVGFIGTCIGYYIESIKDKYYYEQYGNYPWRPPMLIQIKDSFGYLFKNRYKFLKFY